MTRSVLSIVTPDGDMPAHLWLPEAGSGPGVLLLQEIFGVSSYVERRAQDLADAGYVVLAPEIFWRLGVSRVDEGPEALEQAFGLLQRTSWPAAVADGAVGLDALRAQEAVTDRVGILGFCFGGGLGFNVAALSPADALVSYYGSALPELLGVLPFDASDAHLSVIDPATVATPTLHHWGLADTFIDRPVVEQVCAVLEKQPDVRIETYEGGGHAFDNDDFMFYDAALATLAWERTLAFLAERLQGA
ncbi:MAG TPA: dienelactone hydrolase family protein [Nocardioides sp.]|nr:dienelactone hydrolase family protein [Nocardioides sp.]